MLAVALLGGNSTCCAVEYLHLRPPQVFSWGFVADYASLKALQSALVNPLMFWGYFLPVMTGCSDI